MVGFSRSDSEGFVYSKIDFDTFLSKVSFYPGIGRNETLGPPWLDSAGPIVKASCTQKLILTHFFSNVRVYLRILRNYPLGPPWLDSAGPIVKVSCIQKIFLTLFATNDFFTSESLGIGPQDPLGWIQQVR